MHREMIRLNTKLLPPVPKLQCHDNHVIIALLNARSIVVKLPDIVCDGNLKYVYTSILCFCESWLTPPV